jgi:hypothetical protein
VSILTRVRDLVRGEQPLTRADAKLWAAAQTLDDLCELTALWLEGRIDSQPCYYGRVDVDEDIAPGITDTLIALNRAGFLTNNSEGGDCGIGWHGQWYEQHANVTGFATAETYDWLNNLVADTPFEVTPGWWVPKRGACLLGPDEVDFEYDGCSTNALRALRGAVQVTVLDPRIGGRNDLWPVLMEGCQR